MELTKDEALLVLILVSYYFNSVGLSVVDNPVAEGLGEVKLVRRIAKELPQFQSYADLVLKGK